MSNEPIFRGVAYMIWLSRDEASIVLKRLLELHGGKEVSDTRDATRIVTNSDEVLRQRGVRCPGVIVTPEWVYSSVKAGVKQLARFYSADPELFFSSIVVSAHTEIESSSIDEYRRAVMQHGGQWVDAPTEDTTHIISPYPASDGAVVLSEERFLESIARKQRLPYAAVDGKEVSAARLFCDALLAQQSTPQTVTHVADPKRQAQLPHFPYEILAKIFLMMKEALHGWDFIWSPLNLSQVCSRWRRIAHSTPQLWTNIYLNFNSRKLYRRFLNMANQWRDLSAPLPIVLEVSSIYPRGHRNPVIDWIIENAPRIRSLRLILPEPDFHPLLQHPSGLFSCLEELTFFITPKSMTIYRPQFDLSREEYFGGAFGLSWNDNDSMDDAAHNLWRSVSPMSGFRDAPRLRSLTIDADMSGPFSGAMLNLVTWNQLTDIDLRSITLPAFYLPDLLPKFTSALRLALRVDGESSVPAMAEITLPLKTLYFETADEGFERFSPASFLDALVLPDLESLDIKTQYDREGDGQVGLVDLYGASSFKLQQLTLKSFALSFTQFSPFLREMSSLISLELDECIPVDDELLSFLTFNPHDAQPILPVLEFLKFRGLASRFSESLMMQMVESRWTPASNPPTPLRCVSMTRSRSGEGEDHRKVLDWVLQIAEAGLDIHYDR